MSEPKLKVATIKKVTVLKNWYPEYTLLSIIQYDLDNGKTIYERAPQSYKHKVGQRIGYYAIQFMNGKYLYNIIRL